MDDAQSSWVTAWFYQLHFYERSSGAYAVGSGEVRGGQSLQWRAVHSQDDERPGAHEMRSSRRTAGLFPPLSILVRAHAQIYAHALRVRSHRAPYLYRRPPHPKGSGSTLDG